MVFEGPVFTNGTNVTFEGTAEQFYNYVRELNPNYDVDFADILATQAAENVKSKRANLYQCELNKAYLADVGSIGEGIRYLHGVTASCSAPAHTCTRPSCSYNSAILLCDDVSQVLI